MPSLVRLVVAYVGIAVAVYGLASLTGGWLGTPPWWEREVSRRRELELFILAGEKAHDKYPTPQDDGMGPTPYGEAIELARRFVTASTYEDSLSTERRRDGRERISAALVAVGFAAAVVGLASAWPRRGKKGDRER